jgi:Mor family transcriptional regulator
MEIKTIRPLLENKKQSLDRLLDQRDEVIVHAFKNGFSAIQLGKLLNLTRQRIYEVVKLAHTKEQEEE